MLKKGQVTMETIMVYGVVAIVAISGIGALIYFGVLDVDKYLPDKCMISSVEMQCEQWAMNTEEGIGLGIRNLNKYPINISSIKFTTSDESEILTDGTTTGANCTCDDIDKVIDPNSLGSVVANVSANPCYIDPTVADPGQKIKLDYVITYKTEVPKGDSLTQKATGELLATRT